MNNIILKGLPGFPGPPNFNLNYNQINNIHEINDSFIGKNIIVLLKYNKLLFGNFHKDFLYIGELTYPLHRPKRKMRQTFYKKIKILLFFFSIM